MKHTYNNTDNHTKHTISKKKLLKGSLLTSLFLFAAVAAVFGFIFFHSPKATAARALKNTFSEDALGFAWDDTLSLLKSRDYSGTVNITLSRLSLSDKAAAVFPFDPVHLEGLGLTSTYRMNAAGNTFLSTSMLSYLIKPYVRLESYADKDTFAFRLPELFDSWISLHPNTLGADYNNSLFAKASGITMPEDLSLSLFPDSSAASVSDKESVSEYRELMKKRLREAEVTRLEDGMTYEINFAQEKPETYASVSSIRQMQLTINENEEVETLTCRLTLPFQKQLYPAALTLTPAKSRQNESQGELTIYPVEAIPSNSAQNTDSNNYPEQLLTLTFSAQLTQDEASRFTIDFKELTFSFAQTQMTFYGNLTFTEEKTQSTALPVYESEHSLELFSLDLKDLLHLSKETLDNLDRSELRILKEFFH